MTYGGRSKVTQPLAAQVVIEPFSVSGEGGCHDFDFNGSASPGSGSFQTVQVPTSMNWAQIQCWGAAGGEGSIPGHGNTRGRGGYIAVLTPVLPGELLRVYVGQVGGSSSTSRSFGEGGAGGEISTDGSAGGGGTDVRRSPFDHASRLVAAGGGGGAAGWSGVGSNLGAGGDGGYPDGTAGTNGPFGGTGGGGGGQTTGGTASAAISACAPQHLAAQAGTIGRGGDASQQSASCLGIGSGGGGGGWYGGGGGAIEGAGGGGGSSGYLTTGIGTGAQLLLAETGVWATNGLCRICWVMA